MPLCITYLRKSLRESDLVATPRLGIILALVKNLWNEDDLEHLCERLVRESKKPILYGGKTRVCGLSVGAVIIKHQQSSARFLLKEATAVRLPPGNAMTQSKRQASGILGSFKRAI